MGYKVRKQIKRTQAVKRRKKRAKLLKKGHKLEDFYCGKVYIGEKEAD
jgi:hypothetical protein